MKATHFRVSYEGDWNGHRYFYEEEVEAKEYQMKNKINENNKILKT